MTGKQVRVEKVLEKLCRAARKALERPGVVVPVEGLGGYGFVWDPDVEKGMLLPALVTPESYDTGYGLSIARLCSLDYVLRRGGCLLDSKSLELMLELYKLGWHARVWQREDPECWAELVDEDNGGEVHQNE